MWVNRIFGEIESWKVIVSLLCEFVHPPPTSTILQINRGIDLMHDDAALRENRRELHYDEIDHLWCFEIRIG